MGKQILDERLQRRKGRSRFYLRIQYEPVLIFSNKIYFLKLKTKLIKNKKNKRPLAKQGRKKLSIIYSRIHRVST